MNISHLFVSMSIFCTSLAFAQTAAPEATTEPVAETPAPAAPAAAIPYTSASCITEMSKLPGRSDAALLKKACEQTQVLEGCQSFEGNAIFHYDKKGKDSMGKRILVMSLIHGDELPAGTVARSWMERLQTFDSRNAWRVIPISNPDGLKRATRTNANGVDLNRNFPSKNWDREAIKKWKANNKADPRRNPGPSGGSEIEVKCYLKHFDEFKPDFIIAVHTPLAVLDFDGPRIDFPKSAPLPWSALGTYPGSLGQYMWVDRRVPVLTIELTPDGSTDRLQRFDSFQDEMGSLVIKTYKHLEKMNKKSASNKNPKNTKKD